MDSFYITKIEPITEEWILAQMKDLGLKRKDLMEDLGFSKNYMSLLFAKTDNPRKIHLSKQVKALFFYYFEYKKSQLVTCF